MNDQPSKSEFEKELQNYRKQIDAIDSALFELILRRSDIVQQVGTLKEHHDDTHVKLRPTREAQQLLSIYNKFKDSPFPEASALMIWRHLINGSLMIESPLRVVTMEDPQALPDYAREYFGCYADLHYVSDTQKLIEQLQTNQADIGIFPMPLSSDTDPWWLALTEDNAKLRVFLKFPYLPTECVRDGKEAVAVGKIVEEAPTSDAHTVLILRVSADIAPIKLKNAVTSVFKKAQWHCSNKLADETLACFLTVPYEVESSDERINQVTEKLAAEHSNITVAGHFAGKLGE